MLATIASTVALGFWAFVTIGNVYALVVIFLSYKSIARNVVNDSLASKSEEDIPTASPRDDVISTTTAKQGTKKAEISQVFSDTDLPGITILRPLKGVDALAHVNLRSTLQLDYPNDKLQVLLMVAKWEDAIIPLARQVLAEFPERDAKIIVDPIPLGINPKINNIAGGMSHVKHELLWVLDSNVYVPPLLLRREIHHFLSTQRFHPNPKRKVLSNCKIQVDAWRRQQRQDNERTEPWSAANETCGESDSDDSNSVNNAQSQQTDKASATTTLTTSATITTTTKTGSPELAMAEGSSRFGSAPVDILSTGRQDAHVAESGIRPSLPIVPDPENPPRGTIGLVHHLPLACNALSLASTVEAVFLNSTHARLYIFLNLITFGTCVVGKSNLYLKDTLEASGGWNFYARFLAEDAMMSKTFSTMGYRNVLSTDNVVYQSLGKMSWKGGFWNRRTRWIIVRKHTVPLATVIEPFSECLVCSITFASAICYFCEWGLEEGWKVLLANILVWFLIDAMIFYMLTPHVACGGLVRMWPKWARWPKWSGDVEQGSPTTPHHQEASQPLLRSGHSPHRRYSASRSSTHPLSAHVQVRQKKSSIPHPDHYHTLPRSGTGSRSRSRRSSLPPRALNSSASSQGDDKSPHVQLGIGMPFWKFTMGWLIREFTALPLFLDAVRRSEISWRDQGYVVESASAVARPSLLPEDHNDESESDGAGDEDVHVDIDTCTSSSRDDSDVEDSGPTRRTFYDSADEGRRRISISTHYTLHDHFVENDANTHPNHHHHHGVSHQPNGITMSKNDRRSTGRGH